MHSGQEKLIWGFLTPGLKKYLTTDDYYYKQRVVLDFLILVFFKSVSFYVLTTFFSYSPLKLNYLHDGIY